MNDNSKMLFSTLRSSTCCLDPLPTAFFKIVFNCLTPEVLGIINCSLQSGIFPAAFKTVVIKPPLKKSNVDATVIANFRPISNLLFLSKILEKTVYSQLNNYLTSNSLLDIH